MSDYRKMWDDLGMDLENHDLLCQVLPTAVGDVFLTQENRPKAMDFWDMVISEVHGIRPAELIEEQKKGRKVFGTFCVYVPDEVVIAADGIVTVLGPRWGKGSAGKYMSSYKGVCWSKAR